MHDADISAIQPGLNELPGMLATLCHYDSWLGPYHPQTLNLMVQVGEMYYLAGRPGSARLWLERAARDIGRHLGQNHDLRLRVMAVLRDLSDVRVDLPQSFTKLLQ
jgi:hypothetical protein